MMMKAGLLACGLCMQLTGIALAAQSEPIAETVVSEQTNAVHPAPYAKLAADLGTPELVSSAGPKDKSLLKLEFVGSGQSEAAWQKMMSVSIARVKAADTQLAARAIIAKFKASLQAQRSAKIVTFDESLVAPIHAFFEISTADGEMQQGIAYSPADGFVSVIAVAYKHGYVHAESDRNVLKAILSPPR